MKGLLRIISVYQEFEPRVINLIDTFPVKGLGVWAIAQLSGIKSEEGKRQRDILFQKFTKQSENKPLKIYAEQLKK